MATSELGPISLATKRTVGFKDEAGVKDRTGKSINLLLFEGKTFYPFGQDYVNIRNVKMRPDDILVCGYVKTGSYWTWELVTMILHGKAEYSTRMKRTAFLEMASRESYEEIPSPRILSSHHEYGRLPDEAKKLKIKIILTTRNPKDTAVSLYNHHVNLTEIYNYSGEFHDWFELFREGTVDGGDFFDYYLSWEKAINEHPDQPILVVKYEDTKRDLVSTVRKLAEFINVPLTNDQVEKIASACQFGAMKEGFRGRVTEKIMRKGEIGDWKNWLTEEQANYLDNKSKLLANTRFMTIDAE